MQGNEPTHFTAMFGGKMTIFQVRSATLLLSFSSVLNEENGKLGVNISQTRVDTPPPSTGKEVRMSESLRLIYSRLPIMLKIILGIMIMKHMTCVTQS